MTLLLEQPAATSDAKEKRLPGNRDVVIVIALTLLAGAARFGTAAVPALWHDEAATYRRVCGSFAELSAILRHDSFPPLHYYLYWLLGQALGGAQHLTPFWMRFIPALAGTLMVPAVWRLARQFCQPQAALLAATLAACCGFLFAYSHDAKMYMAAWLLVTVNFSCWIAWLRHGGTWNWLAWVASGLAMIGFHVSAIAVLVIEIPAMFGARRSNRIRWAAALCGLALILSGPAAWYFFSNDLLTRSREVGLHAASGLAWVPTYGEDAAPGASPLLEMGGCLLTGYGWPGANGKFTTACNVFTGALLVLAIGALMFGMARPHTASNQFPQTRFGEIFSSCLWIFVPVIVAWRLSQARPAAEGPFVVAGRICMYLAGLLLLALAWRQARLRFPHGRLGDWLNRMGAPALAMGIGVVAGAIIPGIAGLIGGAGSVWIPRYIGFIWPALAIFICAAIWNLRPSPLRWGAIVLLLGANIAQSAALVLVASEPPVGLIASDAQQAQNSDGRLRTYVYNDVPSSAGSDGGTISNTVGRYYLSLQTDNRFGQRGFDEVSLSDLADVRLWSQPQDISDDLRQGTFPQRLVIWDYIPSNSAPMLSDSVPGLQWRIVSERLIPVRSHWTWNTSYRYRRLELARSQ